MPDGKVQFEASVESKQAMKELASLEKAFKKQSKVVSDLEGKYKKIRSARESSLLGGSTVAQEQKHILDLVNKNEELKKSYADIEKQVAQYSNSVKRLYAGEQSGKYNKGLVAINMKRWGIDKSVYEDYKSAMSEMTSLRGKINGTTNDINQRQTDLNSATERLSTPTDKEQGVLDSLNAEKTVYADLGNRVSDVTNKISAMNEEQEKVNKKSGFSNLLSSLKGIAKTSVKIVASGIGTYLSHIANGAITPFKRLSKGVESFGKRLKTAILQGLLFRNIRNMLSKFMETLMAVTKENQVFSASLANLKGTAWTAFAPIANAIIPMLVTFMNILAKVITYVSTLINMMFGLGTASKSTGKSLAGQAKAAQSAGKSTKDATKDFASWDTIQQLHKKDNSGAGTVDPTFNQDWTQASDALDGIKAKIDAGDWYGVGMELAKQLNGIIAQLDNWINNTFAPWIASAAKKLGDFTNGLFDGIDWALLGKTFADGFNSIVNGIGVYLETVNWMGIGSDIATLLNSGIANTDWTRLGQVIGDGIKASLEFAIGFMETFDWMQVGVAIQKFLEGIDWAGLGKDVGRFVYDMIHSSFLLAIGLLQGTNWGELVKGLDTFFSNVFSQIDWTQLAIDAMTLLGSALGAAAQILASIGDILVGVIHTAWTNVITWWHNTAFEDGKFTMQGLLDGILDIFKSIGSWIEENIFTPFVNAFDSIFEINSPSRVMSEKGGYIAQGMLDGITGIFSSIATWLNDNVFSPFMTAIKSLFGIVGTSATTMVTIGTSIITGLHDGVSGAIGTVTTFFTNWWENDFKPVFSFDKVKEIGSNLISGLVEGVQSKWDEIKKFGSGILSTVCNVLGVHSPSTEFAWIGENLIAGLANGATNTEKVRVIFSKLTNDIYTLFINTVNKIALQLSASSVKLNTFTKNVYGMFALMATNSVNSINQIISSLNAIPRSITTYHYIVTVSVGSGSSSSSTKSTATTKAKGLASGSVINPGKKFNAILGDNAFEQEVVSPISTMKQAFVEAMAESGYNKGGSMTLQIDGQTFARITNPYMQKESNRIGIKATGGKV